MLEQFEVKICLSNCRQNYRFIKIFQCLLNHQTHLLLPDFHVKLDIYAAAYRYPSLIRDRTGAGN